MILFFDTETTGKVDFKSPPDAKHQPRLVQLAAVLTEDDGKPLMTLCCIVRPDGFEIAESASKIHGITTEQAKRCGVSLPGILDTFREMANKASLLVAYNCDFDRIVMEGEYLGSMTDPPWDGTSPWNDPMKDATVILKLPGPYGYKWPKLSEAYQFLFNRELSGAHDALVDIQATIEVFFEIKRRSSPQVMADAIPLP
jgi:DNA polymerase III subunit epsilon